MYSGSGRAIPLILKLPHCCCQKDTALAKKVFDALIGESFLKEVLFFLLRVVSLQEGRYILVL